MLCPSHFQLRWRTQGAYNYSIPFVITRSPWGGLGPRKSLRGCIGHMGSWAADSSE